MTDYDVQGRSVNNVACQEIILMSFENIFAYSEVQGMILIVVDAQHTRAFKQTAEMNTILQGRKDYDRL